jgi:phage-related protein
VSNRRPFTIAFYESPNGDKPVLRWIRERLSVRQRRALGYALFRLLQQYGAGVCETEFGRHLGGGLFEFRLRLSARKDGETAVLRVFCHAAGDRVVLLLGAYDKGRDPTRRRQDREIEVARQRLTEYLSRRPATQQDSFGPEAV